jgi:hypothetical protein
MKKLLLVAGIIGAMATADAATFGFGNISDNSGQAAQVASQLSVDVTLRSGRALFWFSNTGPIASSITGVYFDDGPGGTSSDMLQNSIYALVDRDEGYNGLDRNRGVDFTRDSPWSPVSPPNIPGGSTLTPPFQTTGLLAADSDSPTARYGINPGEWLGVVINLATGSIDDLFDALESGVVRIALKVQAIGPSGASDSFVSGLPPRPPQVPDASTTAMLLGVALLGLEGLRRRLAK